MEVVALMSGAQGEEARQEYKEEDGIHCEDDLILFVYGMLWLVALFSCLAKIAVLFSTRVFLSGNPTFILGGIQVPTQENYLGYISTFQHKAKLQISSTM